MTRYVQTDSKDVTYHSLLAMIERAHAELSRLCHGKHFRMTVPVQDDDSDMVIGDALRHAEAFIKAAWERQLQHDATGVEADSVEAVALAPDEGPTQGEAMRTRPYPVPQP